jgi:hypothetical protein
MYEVVKMPRVKQLETGFRKPSKPKVRKHLSMDALLTSVRKEFAQIPDHRKKGVSIPLPDALMSGFAVFSLKEPSLLAFDERSRQCECAGNLKRIYGIGSVPSDTQLRDILDPVKPEFLRPVFKKVFHELQRGKALEPMAFMDNHYLLLLDGTGSFSSETLSSSSCLMKKSRNGKVTYYQQVLGAAIAHPDFREVIPLCPEMIIKQDGSTKNDCERNAAKRFLAKLREDHPRLKLIVVEDALSANGPHIRDLKKYGMRFILGVKPGDHPLLFHHVEQAVMRDEATEFSMTDEMDPKIIHKFRFLNAIPLNQANMDIKVNFLEYWQIMPGKTLHFSWITDITITGDNVCKLMRAGRARWKIENETFNTLKNQGYNFEHNYGLGKEHLSEIFVMLMMLAFLVDQAQQLCCALFQGVWNKLKTKRLLREMVRQLFHGFEVESMEQLFTALLYGYRTTKLEPLYDDA